MQIEMVFTISICIKRLMAAEIYGSSSSVYGCKRCIRSRLTLVKMTRSVQFWTGDVGAESHWQQGGWLSQLHAAA